MTGAFLTQYNGAFIGPVAKVLGLLMNFIFDGLSTIGIQNIGLAIILFTLVIYMALMPLTAKQQRFSKLQQKMAPEIKKLQDKYKGKKDQASMLAQQEEIKAVYGKYGVSQVGSCVQMLIQMPILFALYRVIYSIPAYVVKVKDVFTPLAVSLLQIKGSDQFMQTLSGAKGFAKQFEDASFSLNASNSFAVNTYIDTLNKSSSADWTLLANQYKNLDVASVHAKVASLNDFLGLNIGDSPSYIIKSAASSGAYLLIIGAILIPLLAAFTQWLNVKLMPQAAPTSNDPNDQQAQMMRQMSTMNTIMPLFSAFMCFTLPTGLGLYWIAGAVIRTIQQVVINHHIDKIDLDQEIAKNTEKYEKKLEKQGNRTRNMTKYAAMNTRSLMQAGNVTDIHTQVSQEDKDALVNKAREAYESGKARPGSLLRAANMVREYDEKNNK